MATDVAGKTFVDQLIKEVILPARDLLMDSQYFTDLRAGKLTMRRLQGFSLEHTWFNRRLLKGGGLRLLQAENDRALMGILRGIEAEVTHPDMCKKFGLSIGLTETDFENHIPTFATLSHTSVIVASGVTLNNAASGRTSGLANETIVQRYAMEFAEYLPKAPYNINKDALEFFIVHGVADVDHSTIAAEAVARLAETDRDKELVWYSAKNQVSLKLAKFQAIYDEYA
jgi:pyrroloquinoline quinone (PQQ) biosynthesis protein C